MTSLPSTSASAWAQSLLELLGVPTSIAQPTDSAPIADWASSGAVAITGYPDRPLLPSGAAATAARGAMLALDALVGPLGIRGEALLAERAAISQWPANAPWSLGNHCRAVRARDEFFALSLARQEDLELIPALVSQKESAGWDAVELWAWHLSAREAVDRCRLLGLPAAVIAEVAPGELMRITSVQSKGHRALTDMRVLDLSSLWAGPLCGNLLGLSGAKVMRMESVTRPDGGRKGLPLFDDLLHSGQPSVTFHTDNLDLLHALVDTADIVITSARPRGLASLELDPQRFLASREHGVWVQLSAYGSTGPQADWVGFGDDSAMAAGLVRWIDGTPIPVADALADPLTGIHAAVAAAAMTKRGGTHLIEIALADVAAATAGSEPDHDPYFAQGLWKVDTEFGVRPMHMPRARTVLAPARALGEDTEVVQS
ncbi:MAG: CoA transferase, partial [Actinomycetota bacterium]|nr:CoA transferase [Actinomycetota bacterium]